MAVQIDTTAQIDAVRLREQAGDPAAPAASHWLLYAKAAGLFIEDSSSVVTGPFGTGGGGSDAQTVALTLTNASAGTVNQGDVVFIDDGSDNSFNIDSNLGVLQYQYTYMVGVVLDATILSGAAGKIALFGYVPVINLTGSVTRSSYLFVAGSSSQAQGRGVFPSSANGIPYGAFGTALESSATPKAFLWNPPIQPTEQLLWRELAHNMNSLASAGLVTAPSAQTIVITRIVCRNASVSLTTASWSFGTNATTYDNIIANATHTELTGNTLYTVLIPKIGAAVIAAGATMRINVQTAQGSAATLDCDVYGYFL